MVRPLKGYWTVIVAVATFLLAIIGKMDPSAGQLFIDFLKAMGLNVDPTLLAMIFAIIMIILRQITTTPVGKST